ncbi:hypothetical protein [Streptomyces globosus]|uniref:hypothetical protein n=1 Tax=Streptomyces globosus TaxID=68209 RepID=UPI003632C43D
MTSPPATSRMRAGGAAAALADLARRTGGVAASPSSTPNWRAVDADRADVIADAADFRDEGRRRRWN